ncbi:MAG: APC family permease [Malacoplasma sp.]|nr:APC family permease [Malacoplasma sp.]
MSNQKFSEKQFVFFTLNYIMGFGFITTISSLISLRYFGIIIFALTAIITFAVALVFSRLGNIYKNEYGGSYLYAKKVFKKRFSFFIGWNQFIQGPILAATSPLFIASAIETITNDASAILVIRIISIFIFIILVFVSTLGINLNKKIIFVFSFVKWAILLLGVAIIIYLSFKELNFANNLTNPNNVSVYLIFSNVLSFMYAFGGIEDVSAMIKDVKVKNFRKIIMIVFVVIISFYFLIFILLNGLRDLDLIANTNFSTIYNLVFGFSGVIIFAVGLLFNGIASKISISISSSRKIVVLANDGYLPHFLTKTNKRGEYKNAILFAAFLTIISMLIFWLIPLLLNLSNFFSSVIEIGTMAFLIQYMLTLFTAIVMHFKKKINPIPYWEMIIYTIAIMIIFLTLLIFLIPNITLQNWTAKNTIVLASYFIFIGIGYLLYLSKKMYSNKKKEVNTIKNI